MLFYSGFLFLLNFMLVYLFSQRYLLLFEMQSNTFFCYQKHLNSFKLQVDTFLNKQFSQICKMRAGEYCQYVFLIFFFFFTEHVCLKKGKLFCIYSIRVILMLIFISDFDKYIYVLLDVRLSMYRHDY